MSAADAVVIVLDVQNDYCHPQGALGSSGRIPPDVDRVVDSIESLLAVARSLRVPVVFLRMLASPWFTDRAWEQRGVGVASAVDSPPIAAEGSWGAELYRIRPRSDDLVLDKYRHSGFSYTPLLLVLRALRRDTVVLVGVSTNVCVDATARDAVSHGYEAVIVPECVAGTTTALGKGSLETFAGYVGRVVPLEDVLGEWSSESSS